MSDLPPSWEWTTLGEIADTTLGKMLDRGKGKGYPEVPYLRNVNVQWGRIDTDDLLTMEIPPEQLDFFALRAGDLLVCEAVKSVEQPSGRARTTTSLSKKHCTASDRGAASLVGT